MSSSRESLQRALKRLAAAGLVSRQRRGNQVFYGLRRDDPSWRELFILGQRFGGVGAALRRAQAELGPGMVEEAFLYGSMALFEASESSDLDVFVLGDAELHDLAPCLEGLRDRLGRTVELVSRTRAEFALGLAEGAAYYLGLANNPRIMLLGSDAAIPRAA